MQSGGNQRRLGEIFGKILNKLRSARLKRMHNYASKRIEGGVRAMEWRHWSNLNEQNHQWILVHAMEIRADAASMGSTNQV